ncbi:MAG: LuxR C-terminal-related transcriptional regulator [Bryobacteraceae bacterium]
MEVLILIGDGLSRSEVATRLSITVATVAFHESRIRWRLNLQSTAGLVRTTLAESEPSPSVSTIGQIC